MGDSSAIKNAIEMLEKAGFSVIQKQIKRADGIQLTIIPKTTNDSETEFCYPDRDEDSHSIIE